MKKIGLICATVLMGLTLTACGSSSAQKSTKISGSSSSTKSVQKHKSAKKNKQEKKKQSSISSASSSSSQSQAAAQQNTNNTQTEITNNSQQSAQQQFDKSDPNTWHNVPYKGYPSYDAYCEANGGDPEVQAETANIQHANNVQQGIENPDGSETQNFQNWLSARDNAWNDGNYDFPSYDQNQQW